MSADKSSKSPVDKLWEFFISLRLAITLIIILAVASIFGTVVEQNQPLEKYVKLYGEGTVQLFNALNLFDMYHSMWFLLILVLFTINLSCCTIDRLPRVIKVVRNPKRTLDDGLEKSLASVDRWKKRGDIDELARHYRDALGRAFGGKTVEATDDAGRRHIYAEKGLVSRFGVYVTHLSIIIIFIGAIIGNVVGFKGYANIVQGDSVRTIPVRGGSRQLDLGFEVRCNRFWVEYYPNGQPKAYSSDLSIIDNGREVFRKTIVVNDPLRYKGVWFYQSSYGQAGGTTAAVTATPAGGGAPVSLSLSPGDKVQVPGYGTVGAHDYQANFQGFGPALLVSVEKPGAPPAEFWLVKAYPDFDRQRKDSYVLAFSGLNETLYTGLQVARDPGVNIVWAGCTLMVIGIVIAFFMSHQRMWVRLSPSGDGRVDVTLAGSVNRNRFAFERKFEKMQAELKSADSTKAVMA